MKELQFHLDGAVSAPPSLADAFGKRESMPNDIRELADVFEDAIYAAPQFSWVGLVRALDEFRRPHFVFYLAKSGAARNGRPPIDVGPAYRELALAMMPHRRYLDLYFIDADGLTVDELTSIVKREAAARYQQSSILRAEAISSQPSLVARSG